MNEEQRPIRARRYSRRKGDPTDRVTITLPISIITAIDRDRETGSHDPGRSGVITGILRDRYEQREKELARAS